MTTIDEMDEFFNFDDAARQLDNNPCSDLNHLPSGPYDVDLAFAEPEIDEDAFDSIEHFTASNPTDDQLALQLQHAGVGVEHYTDCTCVGGGVDTTMMSPGDFADFPRWVDGLYFPSKPCAYCSSRKIHCKIIKEGHRKGSCTSCVALSRACSLTFDPDLNSWTSQDNMYDLSKFDLSTNSSKRSSGDFDLDHETLPGINGKVYTGLTTLRPCEYCHNRGYECKVIQEGERSGSCTSCVALEHACSLATQETPDEMELNIDDPRYPNPINAWITTKVPDEESTLFEHPPGGHTIAGLQGFKLPEDDIANTGEGAKVGARFSRESVRILRGWLSTHHRHPYPSDDEKESLQRQTGLNKTQITNWLANARRRGKVRAPRSTSPMPVSNYALGMDIPRRATPSLEAMNPMDRWQHSPPEHEPASITAISKAVASSNFSGHESPYSYGFSDDGSARSIANVSSTSSLGTSHSSGGSFASAFSHKSRGSFGSFSSFGNRGRRRRRRQAAKPAKVPNTLYTPPRTFQCTFCTETFKTKHDWQRHEKSLHLSLERWVCSPNGPLAFCAEHNNQACVYCGLSTPPEGHAETHNHSVCAERSLEERTFYRKDHLRQHLNLVHNVKFQGWSMDVWKVATPEIRSRCGFCGIVMDTWSIRVDHLAEHFKGGRSMADWKGDWGFELPVLEVVENAMPPYLIHDERNTTRPFEASRPLTETLCRTTFDALELGLVDYINSRVAKGETPTDTDLLLEAQKVFNILEGLSDKGSTADSWFRDLIMSSCTPEQQQRLKFQQSKNSGIHKFDLQRLDIKAMERPCKKENDLQAYVSQRIALGLTPTDSELQREACRIIEECEATATFKYKGAVDWFKYLANSSTTWLMNFRRRANLPRSDEMASENIRSTDDTTIDYSIHTYGRLETELRDYTKLQMSLGFTPSDAELQAKARMIIYGNDDPWNQTAADDPSYFSVFKKKYGLAPQDGPETSEPSDMLLLDSPEQPTSTAKEYHSPKSLHWNLEHIAPPCGEQIMNQLETIEKDEVLRKSNPTRPLRYFLNDANCYRRLVRELSRFVTSCMSPNNPTQHVPSDAEIQNQARWVIYDDDDPWNQTAADNAEWLIRFKRDVGLAGPEEGPGLPKQDDDSWNIKYDGSGFSPPYTFPSASKPPALYDEDTEVEIKMRGKILHVPGSTANKFMRNMTSRYPPCAKVFCDRNLENGLNDFMKAELTKGCIPTDSAIQAKAREIAGCAQTAADDLQLLMKFKALHGITENTDLSRHMDQLPDINNSSYVGDFPTNSDSTSDEDMAMLQQFDAELGLGGSGGRDGIAGMPMDFDFGKAVVESQTEMGETDYASLYRVHTATASPLRRRASHITACKAGYSVPRPADGILENNHEDNANLVPHYMGFYPYMSPGDLSLPADAFDVFGTNPDASTF